MTTTSDVRKVRATEAAFSKAHRTTCSRHAGLTCSFNTA